jgi:hypothetical protein
MSTENPISLEKMAADRLNWKSEVGNLVWARNGTSFVKRLWRIVKKEPVQSPTHITGYVFWIESLDGKVRQKKRRFIPILQNPKGNSRITKIHTGKASSTRELV